MPATAKKTSPTQHRRLKVVEPTHEGPAGIAALPDSAHTENWLLGQPPLTRLFEFAEHSLPPGQSLDRLALTDEWRRANDLYQALQKSQAGIANKGTHRALDPVYEPWAEAVRAQPAFRSAFDTLPTHFEMVDLDHLIVSQMHVTQSFVDGLCRRLGPSPGARSLFDACVPLAPPQPPVQIIRVGDRRFMFRCDSTDLRFHDPQLLTPEQLPGFSSFGAIAGVVGLVVGFGANYLNAVRVGRRVMLNNGHHRAVALKALGLRHVPCVVQSATRVDELAVSVRSRVADNAEFYFESARPPLLRDFFDPRFSKLLPIRKRVRQIDISFEVRDHLVGE